MYLTLTEGGEKYKAREGKGGNLIWLIVIKSSLTERDCMYVKTQKVSLSLRQTKLNPIIIVRQKEREKANSLWWNGDFSVH